MRFAAPILSNAAFWAGLAVPAVMVLAIVNDVPGFQSPLPTWQSVFATSAIGLALAGPIAAAGVAVAVANARSWVSATGMVTSRPLWRQAWQRGWPAGLALLGGYGLCVALVASGTRPTTGGEAPVVTLLTGVVATGVPLLAGALVGCVVTAVLSAPLVLIGGYALSALGLVEPTLSWLGVIAGTWIPHAVRTFDTAIAPGLLIAPPLALATLLAMLLSMGLRRVAARCGAVLAVFAVGAGLLTHPLTATQPPGANDRPATALHCVGGKFELCLWPELEPNRVALDTRFAEFMATLDFAELPLPTALTPVPESPTAVRVSPMPDDGLGTTAMQFSESYVHSMACIDPTGAFPIAAGAPESMESIMEMHRASGILAVALGSDPALAAAVSGWTPASDSTPLGHLGVDNRSDALAAFTSWANALPTSCGVADAN